MNHLPVEVCEQIFKNLTLEGLLSSRGTCRRWKQIVDGCPALMKRIHLSPPFLVMDRSYRTLCTIPARGVTLKNITVLSVDSWWESIGPELTFLRLEKCAISVETLVEMLQITPNLKHLVYACENDVAEVESNFTLDKLELLEVYSSKTEILDFFGDICPRLKHFQFGQQNEARKLGVFLRKLKDTLQTIQLMSVENILHDILQLKELTSLDIRSDMFRNETLDQIGASLPILNSLRVTLQWQQSTFSPTFLNSMPKLRSLAIFGQYRLNSPSIAIDFGGLDGLKKLEKLHLFRFKPLNLSEFLQKPDHFVDLTLHYCVFNNWSELFDMIASIKYLERLDLGKLRIWVAEITVSDHFDSLKYLKITHCFLTRKTLKSFIEHCKKLVEVDLYLKCLLENEIEQSLSFSWKKSDGFTISELLDQ